MPRSLVQTHPDRAIRVAKNTHTISFNELAEVAYMKPAIERCVRNTFELTK